MSNVTENPDELKKQADKEAMERQLRAINLTFLLNDIRGRAFLWTMMSDNCGLFSPSFVQNGKDSLTAFEEGKRAVGIGLMQEIQRIAPLAYAQMIEERMTYLVKLSLNKVALEDQPTHVVTETEDNA